MIEPITIGKKPLDASRPPQSIEHVDQNICKEIDRLTDEVQDFWTSPGHDRREYVHSFFQYPAMMVPVVQKRLIEIILTNRPDIKVMLDPFMGSGTSLVACMEKGLDCFGQDINPLAVLVAKARTGPFYFTAIQKKKEYLFQIIKNDRSLKIEANFKGLKKWFKTSVSLELSKIVRAIRKEENLSIRRFYWVILAETVRLTSNDRTSTFKLHIRPRAEIRNRKISPVEMFKIHFENCLADFQSYAERLKKSGSLSRCSYVGRVCISLADSKQDIDHQNLSDNSKYGLIVTSPPYGDNKTTVTYGQHSYLPLQWIDLQDIDERVNAEYIKSTSEIDSRGLGGKLKQVTPIDLELLFLASPSLKKIYQKLKMLDEQKSKKVVVFFGDIFHSIAKIQSTLAVDSYQIWTVGNRTVAGIEIPNNLIMGEFIQYHGSKLIKKISREILRRRMATRNNSASLMTYEDILIFRTLGK